MKRCIDWKLHKTRSKTCNQPPSSVQTHLCLSSTKESSLKNGEFYAARQCPTQQRWHFLGKHLCSQCKTSASRITCQRQTVIIFAPVAQQPVKTHTHTHPCVQFLVFLFFFCFFWPALFSYKQLAGSLSAFALNWTHELRTPREVHPLCLSFPHRTKLNGTFLTLLVHRK